MPVTEEEARAQVIEILIEMTTEWDFDAADIGPETRLAGDLSFSSVDILHMLGTIEMKYQKKFPYDRLILDEGGQYRDVSVNEISRFICEHFDHVDSGPVAM